MIDRQQLNLRIERALVESLDDLARAEHVDRTEVARRILVEGVGRARTERALRDYAAGRATAWKAARDADVSLYEMLDRIHDAGIPYEFDVDELEEGASARRLSERPSTYGTSHAGADDATGTSELRDRYRPLRVAILFVGESSPAQGTHFYHANSNLYRATRAAFVAALGEESVPSGEAFLRFFQDRGCWLVDLADEPVNRMAGAERQRIIDAGIGRLAQTIRDTLPEQVVVIKRDIDPLVRRALVAADRLETPVLTLPFPVRQWRPLYEAGLTDLLRSTPAVS